MIARILQGLRHKLRSYRKGEDGTASVEFVIMIPAFMTIFMGSFESGLLMTRYVMVERALDITVRDLRLGNFVNPTHGTLKAAICANTVIYPDCNTSMILELIPVDQSTWNLPSTDATCVNRSATVQPVTDETVIDPGQQNELMLIRVCAVFDPLFPTTGLGLRLNRSQQGGGYALVAASAFVNEPQS